MSEKPKDKLCAKGLHCDHRIGLPVGRGAVRKQRYRCCGCGMESVGDVRVKCAEAMKWPA